MDFLISTVLNGTIYGLLLFMVASGLTLVFGMMGILNFAHGAFYMVGAYVGFFVAPRAGFLAGIVMAPIITGFIGALCERFVLRTVHAQGHAYELLATFGLLFMFEELIKLIFGPFPVDYSVPAAFNFQAFTIGAIGYPFYRLFAGGVAVAMFAVLYAILRLTRTGLVIRAAVFKPIMAQVLGHNVTFLILLVFALGAAMAGLAGAVAGALLSTSPTMAQEVGTLVFVIVTIGGLGSLEGALIASILIGVLSTAAVGIDWTIADGFARVGLGAWAAGIGGPFAIPLSTMAAAMPYILMLLVLLIRPSGLIGERT